MNVDLNTINTVIGIIANIAAILTFIYGFFTILKKKNDSQPQSSYIDNSTTIIKQKIDYHTPTQQFKVPEKSLSSEEAALYGFIIFVIFAILLAFFNEITSFISLLTALFMLKTIHFIKKTI